MTDVAAELVDAVLADSFLLRPEVLLEDFRNPPGRQPSESSLQLADAAARINHDDALLLVRATLDSAFFGVFALLDMDFKNSDLSSTFSTANETLTTSSADGDFVHAYRERVDPNGAVRAGAPS